VVCLSYLTCAPRPHPYVVIPRRHLVKVDPVGGPGPVMECIHGVIIAATVDAAVGAIGMLTGCGHPITRCAKTHGNHAAGREFDSVSEANIHLWRRQKIRLEALSQSKLAQHRQASAFPELECQLVE